MPTIPTQWYLACQRAIWAIRTNPYIEQLPVLMFNKDRVKLIGYFPKVLKAGNDNYNFGRRDT